MAKRWNDLSSYSPSYAHTPKEIGLLQMRSADLVHSFLNLKFFIMFFFLDLLNFFIISEDVLNL